MRFHLSKNRSNFKATYQSGLASQIFLPLNIGRYVGADNTSSLFKSRSNTDSVNLAEWITNQITLDNITFSSLSTTGDVATSGNLTFTETVTTPATSSSLAIKSVQVVHTTDGGALTEVIPVNIPDGAVILGASILVSTALGFTTGTEVTPTWTNSTQQIGSTTLAAKNSKVTAMYDANAESAIATGTPETITLTANAGTIDSGEVVVTAYYMELTDLTDVA